MGRFAPRLHGEQLLDRDQQDRPDDERDADGASEVFAPGAARERSRGERRSIVGAERRTSPFPSGARIDRAAGRDVLGVVGQE
jgi:hypothetical protein